MTGKRGSLGSRCSLGMTGKKSRKGKKKNNFKNGRESLVFRQKPTTETKKGDLNTVFLCATMKKKRLFSRPVKREFDKSAKGGREKQEKRNSRKRAQTFRANFAKDKPAGVGRKEAKQ